MNHEQLELAKDAIELICSLGIVPLIRVLWSMKDSVKALELVVYKEFAKKSELDALELKVDQNLFQANAYRQAQTREARRNREARS